MLASGAIAGTVWGMANIVLVEPYLDEAIMIENQMLFASGQAEDTPEFWVEYDSYRTWQRGGQVLAGAILGVSVGALFGAVYALSRDALPRGGDLAKALVLAAIMWFAMYVIPTLKYPASLPATADDETVALRAILYLSLITISGFGAVAFYQVYKKMRGAKKIIAFAGYTALIIAAFVLMPSNPDESTIQAELLSWFRTMSAVSVTIFWAALAVTLGYMWKKFMPNSETRLENN